MATFTAQLSETEINDVFLTILCGCVSQGYFSGYGIQLEYDDNHYKQAKENLIKARKEKPCLEDVWLQMLVDGNSLKFEDVEGDGEYTRVLTLKDIREKLPTAPFDNLKALLDGDGDVTDEDIVLQHILYGELIFG